MVTVIHRLTFLMSYMKQNQRGLFKQFKGVGGMVMAVVYTISGTEGTELPDVITVHTVFLY